MPLAPALDWPAPPVDAAEGEPLSPHAKGNPKKASIRIGRLKVLLCEAKASLPQCKSLAFRVTPAPQPPQFGIDGLVNEHHVLGMAGPTTDFDIEVFFDGDCPLCLREVNLLRKLDKESQRIRFTDIQAADFAPASVGLTFPDLMRRIHGRLPTGELVEGAEVFRRLYAAVGFRRAVAVSRWPGVSQLVDAGYSLFAKNRLRLTGRCTDEVCAAPSRRAST
jgi:predicted DCC family thiol-disulfide oxidoreductase YuxK